MQIVLATILSICIYTNLLAYATSTGFSLLPLNAFLMAAACRLNPAFSPERLSTW
jgi:hypothetical protein